MQLTAPSAPRYLIRQKYKPFNKLIVNIVLDENTRPGAAHLSLIEEQSRVRLFDGLLDVDIIQDNVRALPSQLERGTLQATQARALLDLLPHFSRSRERDFVNLNRQFPLTPILFLVNTMGYHKLRDSH